MPSFYWILACAFAGILTFFSPCVLPVLPIVLSTSLGQSKWRPVGIVCGLVFSFTALGIIFQFLGSAFGLSPQVIRWISLTILFLAGVLFLFPDLSSKLFNPLAQRLGQSQGSTQDNFGGALAIGASLGALWTPCAGPIFAFVLSGALLQKNFVHSLVLFFAYSLGAGLPMLAVAYLGNYFVKKIRRFAQYEHRIRRVTGGIMILASILFTFGLDTQLVASLPVSWINTSRIESGVIEKLNGPDDSSKKITLVSLNSPEMSSLPVLGTMPSIEGSGQWINTTDPLTKENLKDKVVLVDFWTYSCINCLRTLPYLKQWYQTYKDQGFIIIGIHTPEFAFEKDLQNVSQAVKKLGILYPVLLDNAYVNWNNFKNQYWPAHYLIDAKGRIRYQHFGEGEYDRTEHAIQTLLADKGAKPSQLVNQNVTPAELDFSQVNSPETYVGYERMERFVSPEKPLLQQTQNYSFPQKISLNTWALEGQWKIEEQRAVSESSSAKLAFQFQARQLNLVMSAKPGSSVQAIVKIDGKRSDSLTNGKDVKDGQVTIESPRLYELLDLRNLQGTHLFEIEFLDPSIEVYAFTFG